jgi:hypothetical protein
MIGWSSAMIFPNSTFKRAGPERLSRVSWVANPIQHARIPLAMLHTAPSALY